MEDVLVQLSQSVSELDINAVKRNVNNAMQFGLPADEILTALNKGMQLVGQKYEAGEYFLSELLVAGEVLKTGADMIKPLMVGRPGTERKGSGTIVVGTVKGDMHDLGKNLFIMFAEAMGFRIEDLGTDVDAKEFVERTTNSAARVVAMSALMSTTQTNMKEVIKALTNSGIRQNVKVIVGGAPITKQFADEIGADAGINDAMKGADICSKWTTVTNV